MKRRCLHRYKGFRATFTPPPNRELKLYGSENIKVALFGVSTVTQTCTKCGEARSYTVPGRVE